MELVTKEQFIDVITVLNTKLLELIYYFTYFSPSSHLTLVCFLPMGLSLLIQHFQQVLKFLLSPVQETEAGDRSNFKTCLKCCINNERPTGKNKQVLDATTVKNR